MLNFWRLMTLPGMIVGGILVEVLGVLPGIAATAAFFLFAWYWVETIYYRK